MLTLTTINYLVSLQVVICCVFSLVFQLWGPGSFSVDEQGDFFTSSSFSVILSRFYFVFFPPRIFVICVFLPPPPPSISLCSCFLLAAYTCSSLPLQHCSLLFFNLSLYRLIFVISFMFLKFFCLGVVCFQIRNEVIC